MLRNYRIIIGISTSKHHVLVVPHQERKVSPRFKIIDRKNIYNSN